MIKRTISYTVVRAAFSVAAGVSLVVAIRLLGPTETGKLALVAGLITVVSPMLAFGTDAALSRFVVKANIADAGHLYSAAYMTLAIATVLLIGVAWAAARFHVLPPEVEAVLALAILLCTINSAVLVNSHMLRGLGRLRFGSVFEGLVELGPRLFTIPLVLFIQRTFLFYLYAQLATLVLLFLVSCVVIWRSLPAHNRAAAATPGTRRLPPRYWLYATQLLLANILALVFVNVTLWLLRYYANPHAVGVFSVGQDVPSAVAGLLLLPLAAPLLYFYTLDDKLMGRSEDIQQGIVLFSAIMGSLSLLLAGLASIIVRVVFGAEFSEAAPIFVIYALVPFLISWHPMLNAFIYSQNQAHQLNLVSAGQLVMLVGLSLLLIPRFGAAGAALSVMAAYVGANLAYALLIRKRWPGTLTTLLRVYGLFVPFVLLGRTPFWYLGLVAYPGVLLLTGTLNIDRLRALVKSAFEWRWRFKPSEPKVVEP